MCAGWLCIGFPQLSNATNIAGNRHLHNELDLEDQKSHTLLVTKAKNRNLPLNAETVIEMLHAVDVITHWLPHERDESTWTERGVWLSCLDTCQIYKSSIDT